MIIRWIPMLVLLAIGIAQAQERDTASKCKNPEGWREWRELISTNAHTIAVCRRSMRCGLAFA